MFLWVSTEWVLLHNSSSLQLLLKVSPRFLIVAFCLVPALLSAVKLPHVTPVHKSGPASDPNDFRPISNYFEAAWKTHMYTHLMLDWRAPDYLSEKLLSLKYHKSHDTRSRLPYRLSIPRTNSMKRNQCSFTMKLNSGTMSVTVI